MNRVGYSRALTEVEREKERDLSEKEGQSWCERQGEKKIVNERQRERGNGEKQRQNDMEEGGHLVSRCRCCSVTHTWP